MTPPQPYEGHVELIDRAHRLTVKERQAIVSELEAARLARGLTADEYFWLRAVKLTLHPMKRKRKV